MEVVYSPSSRERPEEINNLAKPITFKEVRSHTLLQKQTNKKFANVYDLSKYEAFLQARVLTGTTLAYAYQAASVQQA